MPNPIIQPPKNTEVFEHTLASYWFDKEGILYTVSKNTERTTENLKDNIEFIKKLLRNKKTCVITDATKIAPFTKDARDYLAGEMKNVYKAVALISDSPFGSVIVNNFILHRVLDPNAVPMKMFKNEGAARDWLKNYL